MPHPPIVAVSMVKNEDLWIKYALRSIREFVDEIIVIDTGSTDETVEIARRAGAKIKRVDDLRKTHDAIEVFLSWRWGWIFGVDGDELYDLEGLRRVRAEIDSGALDDSWQIEENFLHATEISNGTAKGYLGPPSKAPSKLYNLLNLVAWPSDGRTLFHPKTLVVREGCLVRDPQYQKLRWKKSPLRCLHTRFLPRSSKEQVELCGARPNPEDLLKKRTGRNERNVYRRGSVVEVDAAPFFL